MFVFTRGMSVYNLGMNVPAVGGVNFAEAVGADAGGDGGTGSTGGVHIHPLRDITATRRRRLREQRRSVTGRPKITI